MLSSIFSTLNKTALKPNRKATLELKMQTWDQVTPLPTEFLTVDSAKESSVAEGIRYPVILRDPIVRENALPQLAH